MTYYQFCQVPHASADYKRLVELRFEILRKPLGLGFSPEQLAGENTDFHLAALENGHPLACLVLSPLSGDTVKLRQMAVSREWQRKGLGTALIRYAEKWADEHGFEYIKLHARKTAAGFYNKLGYTTDNNVFTEVGIPHLLMQKSLKAE
jgi:GNAT superfamily N-acetyltransferase